MPRKRHLLLALAALVQVIVLLTLYIEPLYLISRSRFNIDGTLRERLSIVIASNRAQNIVAMKNRIDFAPVKPSDLVERRDMDLTGSKEDIIRKIYIYALQQCDKVYCMIVEDDVVFLYNEPKDVLFDNLISYNNDNDYVFDCSKKGFLRKNYEPNGNGSYCRVFSGSAVRKLLKCLPKCTLPVDMCFPSCLEGFEEKRFLLAQHAGFKSSKG
ncbi:hypothetical protein BGZ94_006051 [Podila epigama]|nr:hypothetical protein BGZ94_006051 [Podila epigama]